VTSVEAAYKDPRLHGPSTEEAEANAALYNSDHPGAREYIPRLEDGSSTASTAGTGPVTG
jgi:hypothetical protein